MNAKAQIDALIVNKALPRFYSLANDLLAALPDGIAKKEAMQLRAILPAQYSESSQQKAKRER